MPKKVRLYACRSFDPTLQTWSKSSQRYTLDVIAKLSHSEPVMDDWIEAEQPTEEEIAYAMSHGIMQGVDPPPGRRRNLRLIVAGGRDYADEAAMFRVLDRIHKERTIAEIIHGGAPGADTLADEWAKSRGIKRTPCPAEWENFDLPGAIIRVKNGRRYVANAGPIRNRHMLTLEPDGVVLFPGGRGTGDMRAAAIEAGVKVWEPLAQYG